MVRYARAKGSKSSNEKLPNEATPWHVMKEQLEETERRKNDTPEKKKTAKQLLTEKEEPYYATSLNVNTNWAEFENKSIKDKHLLHHVKGGKIKKKKSNIQNIPVKHISSTDVNLHTDKFIKQEKTVKTESNEELTKSMKIKQENNNSNDSKEDFSMKKKNKRLKENKVNNDSDIKHVENNMGCEDKHKFSSKLSTATKRRLRRQRMNQKKLNESMQCDFSNTDNENNTNSVHKRKNLDSIEKTISCKSDNKNEEKINTNNPMSKRQKRNLKKRKLNDNEKDLNDKEKELNDNRVELNCNKEELNDNEKELNKSETTKFENSKVKNDRTFFESKQGFDRREFNRTGAQKIHTKIPRHNHTTPGKVRDNEIHARRKPEVDLIKMNINGIDVEIVQYDGFPVRKEDAERLKELRRQMVMKGIPKSEIDSAMKLERRKAEKALTRIKKQVCFLCRKSGHNLSDCPNLEKEHVSAGICFKCGSTEHTHFDCKVNKTDDYRFASCFICRQRGHIAKQCPDNPKGLYPDGGSCKICGDVTHLKKDCPDLLKKKEDDTLTLNTISSNALECLDEDLNKHNQVSNTTKQKIVKF